MLRARVLIVAAVIGACAGLGPGPALAQTPDAYFEFLMARRLESEGNNPAALAALERAAKASPESAEVKAEIAAFHYRRNQRAEAEKAARAALALDEKSVEANRVLGQILTAMVESAGDRPSLQTAATLK
jgi:tetratricopeptide (TPR) repeat protein